jgi:hypothetical protein
MSWEERMREAQRRGHEDALAGRFSMPDETDDAAWAANYRLGFKGEQPQPPLPWQAELWFTLLAAAEIEFMERLGLSEWLTLLAWRSRARVRDGLAKRRAIELGLGRNDELPLLRADPSRISCAAAPVIAGAGAVARRRGMRTSLAMLASGPLFELLRRYGWRRAGLPTKRRGRRRASAPA